MGVPRECRDVGADLLKGFAQPVDFYALSDQVGSSRLALLRCKAITHDTTRQGVIDRGAAWARAQWLSVMIGLFQNPLRRDQIGCAETLPKAVVDRPEAGEPIRPVDLP